MPILNSRIARPLTNDTILVGPFLPVILTLIGDLTNIEIITTRDLDRFHISVIPGYKPLNVLIDEICFILGIDFVQVDLQGILTLKFFGDDPQSFYYDIVVLKEFSEEIKKAVMHNNREDYVYASS